MTKPAFLALFGRRALSATTIAWALPALLGALVIPGAAMAQRPPKGMATMFALPSDIIAREIGFARAVRDKGQWQAFRDHAAPDAQMFDGDKVVRVQDFARRQPNPVTPLQWQVHNVWMSCDGATAISYGGWQQGAAHGWFSTVWQRQKKGHYLFVLDQGGVTEKPMAEPEWAEAKVAECAPRGQKALEFTPLAVGEYLSGESSDHSLEWKTSARPDGTRDYVVEVKIGGKMTEVLRRASK